MKSFKQFLIENTTHKVITQAIFNKLSNGMYKNNIKHAYENGSSIFRGTYNSKLVHNAISLYGFNNSERKSANTSNIYNTILSTGLLDSWEEYPKRNTSFICTTNKTYAENYGYIISIIPPDNTKLGVCSENDFWFSFKKLKSIGIYDMETFNHVMELFIDIVIDDSSIDNIGYKDSSYIKKVIIDTDNKLKNLDGKQLIDLIKTSLNYDEDIFVENNKLLLNLTNDLIQYDQKLDFVGFLNNILSPENNNFGLIEYSSLKQKTNKEVWFSGEALFITDWNEFENMYKESIK